MKQVVAAVALLVLAAAGIALLCVLWANYASQKDACDRNGGVMVRAVSGHICARPA